MLSRSAFLGKGGHPSLAPNKACAIPPRFKNAGHPGAVSVTRVISLEGRACASLSEREATE
jgi:hypothetical protein